jgi:hypothetical protein
MHPDYLKGAAALALISGGLRLSKAPTPEQLEQMRRGREAAIAAKRAASPEVAAAEAKRARKRAKLLKLEARKP